MRKIDRFFVSLKNQSCDRRKRRGRSIADSQFTLCNSKVLLIEMFVASISFGGTFKSFWDLTEVSDKSCKGCPEYFLPKEKSKTDQNLQPPIHLEKT